MLYRKLIVSTRTLFQLTVAMIFLASGMGTAFAAPTGQAPILVPYTIQAVAGNTQPTKVGNSTPGPSGYGGDGTAALNATFNGSQAIAVDSVGNIYLPDAKNAVIREINAQTGIIMTVAGKPPSSCSGVSCAKINNGCADNVPAVNSPIGSNILGIAVDGFGNIYFADITTETISVIYKGGAQVANFISEVNPAAAPTPASVKLGYVYHVGGSVNLSTCVTSSIENYDNLPAFGNTAASTYVPGTTSASLHMNSPQSEIDLDSAGNIYIMDISNGFVRVINTQATAQVFFQTLVEPGYMTSILNCGVLTVPCPSNVSTTSGTGIGGPADAVTYIGDLVAEFVDAYGNVFEMNFKGASPGIYAGFAYAGGAPLAALQQKEWGITVSYGNYYEAINNIAVNTNLPLYWTGVLANSGGAASGGGGVAIRPVSISEDINGSLWYWDEHYPSIFRIDPNSAVAVDLMGWGGQPQPSANGGAAAQQYERSTNGVGGTGASYAAFTAPQYCVYGTLASPFTAGPQDYDRFGDGCPSILGAEANVENGYVLEDGPGNAWFNDNGDNVVRVFPIGNYFYPEPTSSTTPVTIGTPIPVGTSLTQPIQVHFDASNLPVILGASPNQTTTAFSIPTPSDFKIDITDPEFQFGSLSVSAFSDTPGTQNSTTTLALYSGIPSCSQLGTPANDASIDCLVYVTFTPTQVGIRQGQLIATTANGGTTVFSLNGYGGGTSLAIDGGQQTVVPFTGLGKPTAVAVTSTGTVYAADPNNNWIAVCSNFSGSTCGAQSKIGPSITVTTPVVGGSAGSQTLKNPMGVAVDGAGNVYIADTGNNRVLKYVPSTQTASLLGQILWVACTTPSASSITAVAPGKVQTPVSCTAAGNTVPQYAFNGPEGVAVDSLGNVYVADTLNGKLVEIPDFPNIGGASPLYQYPGAPTFVNPVGVAIGANQNTSTASFTQNNVYVADTLNPFQEVVLVQPNGGDLQPQNLLPLGQHLPLYGGQNLTTPSGVAVDGAGDVYISDSTNNVVVETPAQSNSQPFNLSFTGLSGPTGLAIDASGNIYVADTGNSRVLVEYRQNPVVPFGMVPQDLASAAEPLCSNTTISDGLNIGDTGTGCVVTITNTGTQTLTLAEPVTTATNPNPAVSISNTCGATLLAGATCVISPTYTPPSSTAVNETVTVNGGPQSFALTANGGPPTVNMALSLSGTPTSGGSVMITAALTQTHPTVITPTGTVTFTYTIDAGGPNAGLCGSGGSSGPVALVNGVASYTISGLLQGRAYLVTATYNGDANDGPTVKTLFSSPATVPASSFTVPGISGVSASASNLTYVYGTTPPAIAGTVTGIDSSVTYKFVSGASASSAVSGSPYPISLLLTGGDECNYGNIPVYSAGTTPATVTETAAKLTISLPTFTTPFGAPNVNYGLQLTLTGAVNGDQNAISATFNPASSQNVTIAQSPEPVVPTLVGKPITAGDYTISVTNGTLVVTPAPSLIGITATKSPGEVLPTAVPGATYAISLSTAVPAGATPVLPSGTITVFDTVSTITASQQPTPGVVTPACPTVTAEPLWSSTTTYTAGQMVSYSGGFWTAIGTATNLNDVPANGSAFWSGIMCIEPPQEIAVVTLANGLGTFTPPTTAAGAETVGTYSINAVGLHQFSFAYSGDANFQPSVNLGSPFQTIQSAVTAACTLGTAGTTVVIQPGASPSDTVAAATGGCTTAGLIDYRAVPAKYYTWSGTAYATASTFVPTAAVFPVGPAQTAAACVVQLIPVLTTSAETNCLLVDNPDFSLISIQNGSSLVNGVVTSLIPILPGTTPSGNGLPSASGQNGSFPETALFYIYSLNTQVGTLSLSCLPIGNPNTGVAPPVGATTVLTSASYIQCTMTPSTLILTSNATFTSVLSVYTPANEPLNYNFFSEVRMHGSETALAFLPLGVLAFCLRRRRRLSKALWMLFAIAAVSAGMSGCGGNQVDFYSPIPSGEQYVTVTVQGVSSTSTTPPANSPTYSRSYTVPIFID